MIRDITIFHGGHFAILVTGCDNLTVDNVTMDTNRDGMDMDCCRNTMVSNCRVNSPNDDGICPKSTYALGEARITENLTIVNCQVSGFAEGTLLDGTMKPAKNGTGRIKFGTESSGGFRNCTVANCTFRSCHGLALEEVDGGIMENITINNLTMMDVREYAIYITTGKRNRTPNLTTNSRARNILISNVIADGVDKMSGIQIMRPAGTAGGRRASGKHPAHQQGRRHGKDAARNAQGTRHRLSRTGQARHTARLRHFCAPRPRFGTGEYPCEFSDERFASGGDFCDIQGLEIDNFKPQVAAGVKAAVFADNVGGPTIRNSPALEK